jgi:hypothetical protein
VTRRGVLIASGVYLAASVGLAAWLLPAGREQPPFGFSNPTPKPVWKGGNSTLAERTLALRQARVWARIDAAAADVGANPPDPAGTLSDPMVRCKYLDSPAHGTTTKFDCVLRDGEVVKVKYGHTGEIHAEVAASRLLSALGFGADRMFIIPRVRCYGCVRTPFYTAWAFDYVHARERVMQSVPDDSYTDFDWVAVERRFGGSQINAAGHEGWAWYELEPVDASRGATRAERDALRLAATIIAHWDNKAPNQRLVCLAAEGDGPCPNPFAYIQDLGASFGPNKMDLEHWRAAPIWADAARCTLSMRPFPYDGGTFKDVQISEAGRQLIARQLAALSGRQLTALFTAARFPEFHGGKGEGADVNAWVQAFRDKVRQIVDRRPCAA